MLEQLDRESQLCSFRMLPIKLWLYCFYPPSPYHRAQSPYCLCLSGKNVQKHCACSCVSVCTCVRFMASGVQISALDVISKVLSSYFFVMSSLPWPEAHQGSCEFQRPQCRDDQCVSPRPVYVDPHNELWSLHFHGKYFIKRDISQLPPEMLFLS